jgi:hypothetical protein
MNQLPISENEQWILSFYRNSEIAGALFFGRLAKSMRPGPIQNDMTKHFADESQHAWYWNKCLNDLGVSPVRVSTAYQDNYLKVAGMPMNVMEVLAITQVFEIRVIGQYSHHRSHPGLHPVIHRTITQIMEDEKWHIQWIAGALKAMEPEYGREFIEETFKRFQDADREVYRTVLKEHEERIAELFEKSKAKIS